MNTFSIIADSPQEAITKARQTFGPEAVIQEVRKQPRTGLSRLWKQPRLELVVAVPSPAANIPADHPSEPETPSSFFDAYQKQSHSGGTHSKIASNLVEESRDEEHPSSHAWRVEPLLRRMGLSDYWIDRLLDRLSIRFQAGLPDYVKDELAFCRSLLMEELPSPKEDPRLSRRPILLMGAPGCGKTTVLCKWMTHLVFQQQAIPEIWRLDGDQPNTAESLSLYSEMLGASISRFPTQSHPQDHHGPILIDMPGVSMEDGHAMKAFEARAEELPDHDRYLVLNACYATKVLEDQIKAFMPMAPKGIILTHLDEEKSWGRLTNLLLGTNCPVCLLSGGQKIPGLFETFRPTRFLTNVFPSCSAA